MPKLLVAAGLSLLVIACGLSSDDRAGLGEDDAELVATNGVRLNGVSLNGVSLNGVSLNGASLNGVRLNGVRLNGVSLTGTGVSNATIQGVRSGVPLTGAGMVGSTFDASISNGATITLRIDGARALPAPNADVLTYAISYQTTTGWKSLCPGANEAIALPGTWNLVTVRHQWDANMFTLACRAATFAKCYELGYKGDSKLDTYHQACIRALRADYCGDGTSRTIDGTQINIYDKLGVQADTESWNLESNWTPDGATCISKARVVDITGPTVPECLKVRAAVACTPTWGTAILRTEIR